MSEPISGSASEPNKELPADHLAATETDASETTSDSASTRPVQRRQLDQIFALLKENKIAEATQYVNEGRLAQVDCEDEHGTTPLQYAAFRGLYDLCRLLISRGADVNAKTHDQGYSALMFAAISNHKRVVSLLLEHEADADYRNVIGRTATQMAAFVNSHECVDRINCYVSKRALAYFTEIRSISETQAKLPGGECLAQLHRLLIDASNCAPVRMLKQIQAAPGNVLMANGERIVRTLDAFCERAFKNEEGDCPNDILAVKLHHYKYIFEYVIAQRKLVQSHFEAKNATTTTAAPGADWDSKAIEFTIKQFLSEEKPPADSSSSGNGNGSGGESNCRVFQEKFLRESIRQFPYKECGLLRQMVTILARTAIGAHPSALYVITSCLNGQKFGGQADEPTGTDADEDGNSNTGVQQLECATCGHKSTDAKWCTHCKQVAYCDQFCQRLHWPIHKKSVTADRKKSGTVNE